MSESIVVRFDHTLNKWGVVIDGVIIATSKSNCDAVFGARQMAKLFDPEPEVINRIDSRDVA